MARIRKLSPVLEGTSWLYAPSQSQLRRAAHGITRNPIFSSSLSPALILFLSLQLLELARYLEEAKPEVAGVAAETEQQIAAAETPEALLAAITGTVTKIVDNCSVFLAKNKEAEATAPFYALEKLCLTVDPEDARGLLVKMAEVAAAGDDKPQARARMYVGLRSFFWVGVGGVRRV